MNEVIKKNFFFFFNVENSIKNKMKIYGSISSHACIYLQKQVQKAKNHLKRVVKNSWTYEDAEYLERAWLLLTDIYIQSGKMEIPVELIQNVLQYNKGCYKAYDYAGIIAEKEQLYKDAALQYENAWRYAPFLNSLQNS